MKANYKMSYEKAHILTLKSDNDKITEVMRLVKKEDVNLFYRAKGRVKDIQDELKNLIFEAQFEYDSFTGKRYKADSRERREDNFTIGTLKFY